MLNLGSLVLLTHAADLPNMSTAFAYDVFLSHNSKDKPRVRKLAERLKQAGLRVWFDEWVIKPGDDIYLAIERGLEEARVQVLCLSPAALGAEWVTLERSTILFRDPTNQGRRFIPLLLADCKLPDTLRRYKYVDFREEAEASFEELLDACGANTGAPPERAAVFNRNVKATFECDARMDVSSSGITPECLMQGHSSWIGHIAWSPDGRLLASPSGDETIRLWDLTGRCLKVLNGHSGGVICAAFDPSGRSLASGGADASVKIWDVATGHLLRTLRYHWQAVYSVDWSPNGERLTSASSDQMVLIWDPNRDKPIQVLDGHSGIVEWALWAPNGKEVISASWDTTVRIWDSLTGLERRRLHGHAGAIYSLALGKVNDRVVIGSAGSDATIHVWNTSEKRAANVIEGHKGWIKSLAFSCDGKLLASKGHVSDPVIRIWRCDMWCQVASIREEPSDRLPAGISFHPRLPLLATLGEKDTIIRVWRLDGDSLLGSEARNRGQKPPRKYVNAKVVLLGEGTVGKTSLAHRLIEDQYVVRDRTHGMNVWRLDLPLPPDTTREREALLWDLAGQEDYRLIHPLFLQETALALLLVNPQTANPFRETGDWLKMLKSAANKQDHQREADRLLILSQVDVGGPKLSDAKLDQFCRENGFDGWLLTSALNGRNCSDKENGGRPSELKQLIAASIPWDKLPWTSTPRVLAELKNAVMAMRDKRDIRLLRFSELAQRLEQALPKEKFGESDVRTAVTLLANHGLARPLKFGDLVLLQPELINGYAAAIIRAARAHTDEIGCVLEENIYKSDFDFTGVERLKHRPDEELLLHALVQIFLDHSLCIAEDTPHGRHLVFPSQYRREKDIPRDPDIFVSYTFSGEWQTVWTTLVVRLWYSQGFQHRELWRNAAEFSFSDRILGLKIDNQQGEGTATISLYFDKEVTDEVKAIFIGYIHRHLARYGSEVSRDRRYVCPECGKPVKDLDAVRKRLDAKKEFITCQDCDERVPLIDFIEQRLKSDPVARKILAMDEVTTHELDTRALEQILIGHMMAIVGEANQIFRPVTMFDHGIDGEVEFKDNNGKASGKRIYIQLKSGNSYLRTRKSDGSEVFDVKDGRHLEYWISQPVDVYLVIRQTDETNGGQVIRWMNVTRYLKERTDKESRQIIFKGDKLDMEAVWKVRDQFFPPKRIRA